MNEISIKPQAGPQEEFLCSQADIAIYGGAAGGGKTFGLLLEPLRHLENSRFGAVIFRKQSKQIRNQGGLWDESVKMYLPLGAHPRESYLEWSFPSGMQVQFDHLENDMAVYKWQGSQIPLICCEENEKIKTEHNHKLLKQIKVGDRVLTLQGPKKVLWVGKRRLEECVYLTSDNVKQIHSTTHKILTPQGWVSYEDAQKASWLDLNPGRISKQLNFSSRYGEYFGGKFLKLWQLCGSLLKYLPPTISTYQSKMDRPTLKGFFSYKARQDQDNGCVLSGCSFQSPEQPPSIHLEAVRFLRFPGSQDHASTRGKLQYVHPYRGYSQTSEADFCYVPCEIKPCGKKWVIDLTVESESHYITQSGIVNRNCFDELTHFSAKQFFYMLSRNRSDSKVRGYVRATCNPDADSWVRDFISWWIGTDGYPDPTRTGKVRWFVRSEDTFYWADTPEELISKLGPDAIPKSVTFIPSNVHDNRVLMENDPSYIANLRALSRVDRERLEKGNWDIRESAGTMFRREWFPVVDAIPAGWISSIRFWDRACLIGDTKIKTIKGQKRIDKIKIGEQVLTRKGYQKVSWSGVSKTTDKILSLILSNGTVISGTSCHPAYTLNRGWVPLGELNGFDRILTGTEIWKLLKKYRLKGKDTLFSTDANIISTIKDISSAMNGMQSVEDRVLHYCIEMFTNFIKAPYPLVFLSTTKTETDLTTELKTLNAFQEKSTGKSINLIEQHKLVLEIQNTAQKHLNLFAKKRMNLKKLSAYRVGSTLIKEALKQNIATLNVVEVAEVELKNIPVYDLSVENQPEFIANGILVHNSTKPHEGNKDPDWTRGLKLFKYPDNSFIVADIKSIRDTPGQVEKLIKNVASHDGTSIKIMSQQDPGSAGVQEADNFVRMLAGYPVKTIVISKDKVTRAKPVSAQAEAGNIRVLRAPWNDEFFKELDNFPDGTHDDIVDTLSGAFNELAVGHSILDVYQNLR